MGKAEHRCCSCDKKPLTKNEIGLTKKLISEEATMFYCLTCLSEYLEVTEDELQAKIEDFKNDGCTLFQ